MKNLTNALYIYIGCMSKINLLPDIFDKLSKIATERGYVPNDDPEQSNEERLIELVNFLVGESGEELPKPDRLETLKVCYDEYYGKSLRYLPDLNINASSSLGL